MIAPLSQRPFHTLRWKVDNLVDSITAIFYEILSQFNSKWEDYRSFYAHRENRRDVALSLYPNEIIQISSNQLHPSKVVNVPQPSNLDLAKYTILTPKEKTPMWRGICSGMCVDHMRRVKASNKSFFGALQDIALKYVSGSTKKGFVYYHTIRQITVNEESNKSRLLNKIMQILDAGEPDALKAIIEAKNSLTNKMKLKRYSYFLNNFKNKFVLRDASPNYKSLPDGDYFLIQNSKGEAGHAICLYKRAEGYAVFDPNYGSLFFKDNERFTHFIKDSMTKIYKEKETSISIYNCKEKSA